MSQKLHVLAAIDDVLTGFVCNLYRKHASIIDVNVNCNGMVKFEQKLNEDESLVVVQT